MGLLGQMHKEDVNAALRKRFGSVAAFERAKALPEKSVHDLLRGRPSARVRDAVESAITLQSDDSDCAVNSAGQK